MASFSGILQRPVVAASAVAIASVSTDLHEKFWPSKSIENSSSEALQEKITSWVSQISVSKLTNLSFVTRIRVPSPSTSTSSGSVSNLSCSSLGTSSVLVNFYQSAALAKSANPSTYTYTVPYSPSEVLYRWHLPEPNAVDISGNSDCSSVKSRTVVVLLGWLGAKQKHLKRYAEWYASRGYHAIIFTFPMSEILSYQVGGKAEQDIELLVNHLADWLEEEHGKNLVFHTFSNTGWLTYGVILEKFQKQDPILMTRIKGCIFDSAPVAAPDPQVWASGFSAAFLKKNSVATKRIMTLSNKDADVTIETKTSADAKPAVTEAALLVVLEKFFEVVLNLPAVNRRLYNVLDLLTSGQPSCPQLYMYSQHFLHLMLIISEMTQNYILYSLPNFLRIPF
uniref:Transmembrane protein 53-A n=1 Tax=Nicotiana tabacum TaxID=4097 RepID=A0A1S3XQI0_TOBAC|nr:PREDICTED: transmembrane protein 53-A-like [Nicotiana tabacum]XP_016442206.1 PREDICTED: transmembrane protein 53-A-like [Nicotiana tabacum]XP_016442207.1 PREDICTED: transmembrane protein 53-A-like [Nicotiana tabacum]XP_016442208.1 PREDICTED: transmembrane protein 53-A-like [Nicotiana tabacum]XP_016442209.1 PREDICTED: transmembrane protein 53-A-like [Nicotiana tabacum]XP_016442211.1 PREDICTED: transmembrane protein 53-A-like [Nicotiana tabacum]XP_016442212.1 PREDICTED: transmembrane protein